MKSEIGLIGLGVMGTSLARNIARNKYSISLYNRYVKGSEEAVAKKKIEQYRELESAKGFEDIEAFVDSLQQPRKIILMLTAGVAVDELIDQLVPHMDQGDLIIDAGNSHYRDSQRRYDQLEHKGFHFIGLGVSGGEEGALKGPSLMPGGSKEAYDLVEGLFCSIAAKTKDNKATSAYVGSGGAGHFVKMVHNGIEYAEMQLIAEFFQIMKLALEMDHQQIASVFEQWNQGDLKSYLLEITIDILRAKDQEGYLLDRIQDKAAHKGTGAWSLVAAAELGQAATMIASALFSRYTSSKKRYRTKLSQLYSNPSKKVDLSVADLKATYRFARIVNHHQGFSLIHVASKKNHWEIDLGVVCKLWTEGCIIKSDLLDQLYEVLNQNLLPLSDSSIAEQINSDRSRIEQLLSRLISTAVPVFSISNAYEFFKQLTQEQSGANLIQAQRDYFGAHGVQLLGDDSDELHHLNWNN
jgi:6-phosphogluconate dehydrogenase